MGSSCIYKNIYLCYYTDVIVIGYSYILTFYYIYLFDLLTVDLRKKNSFIWVLFLYCVFKRGYTYCGTSFFYVCKLRLQMQTKYADMVVWRLNLQTCRHCIMQIVYLQVLMVYFVIYIYFWLFLTKFLEYRKKCSL